jgi:hypothetical protein
MQLERIDCNVGANRPSMWMRSGRNSDGNCENDCARYKIYINSKSPAFLMFIVEMAKLIFTSKRQNAPYTDGLRTSGHA